MIPKGPVILTFVLITIIGALFYLGMYRYSIYHQVGCLLDNSTESLSILLRKETTVFREPVIYVITPTYERSTQQPDLTRLVQTLNHVEGLHWIVVEDALTSTKFVANLLNEYGLNNTHLNVATTAESKVNAIPNENIIWKLYCRILLSHV